MKLVYPAIFDPWEDGPGYTVTFPDLPGCITEGDCLSEALFMAEDAAGCWLLSELEDGHATPQATDIRAVTTAAGAFVNLIAVDVDAFAEKYGDKAVRKNLTIPAWLNTFAEKQNINFSHVLNDALTSIYNQTNQ